GARRAPAHARAGPHHRAVTFFLFQRHDPHHDLHPFPTRRSSDLTKRGTSRSVCCRCASSTPSSPRPRSANGRSSRSTPPCACARSEEHTSELQSRENLVCRLLLEKKKKVNPPAGTHYRMHHGVHD